MHLIVKYVNKKLLLNKTSQEQISFYINSVYFLNTHLKKDETLRIQAQLLHNCYYLTVLTNLYIIEKNNENKFYSFKVVQSENVLKNQKKFIDSIYCWLYQANVLKNHNNDLSREFCEQLNIQITENEQFEPKHFAASADRDNFNFTFLDSKIKNKVYELYSVCNQELEFFLTMHPQIVFERFNFSLWVL